METVRIVKGEAMAEQTFEACEENLNQVLDFVCRQLEIWNCSMKAQTQLEIAVEELFINIASYAYPKKADADKAEQSPKTAKIQIELRPDHIAEITFYDNGIPYNPLERPDPDVTKPAEERDIGGLGVFLVKKTMDEVKYRYENGQNILTIRKKM